MDNDDALVGTILTRREAFRWAIGAGVGLAGASWVTRFAYAAEAAPATQPHLVATPVLTEGPFFVDEKLNRSDLLSGTTRATVVNGMPLALNFMIHTLRGDASAPLADAQIDVWHTDAAGVYSDEDNPMNFERTANQKWLRGYQITDKSGVASFKTIVPGWYQGRTTHIHFKVRQFSKQGNTTAEFTSQLFFDEADLKEIYAQPIYQRGEQRRFFNVDDDIFNERQADGTTAGSQLQLKLAKESKPLRYSADFSIVLTDGNMHGGGERGPGRGGPLMPPGGDSFFPQRPPM